MAGVRVVADSACDLPEELVARHRLTIVPLTIRFGAEELADVGPKDFWVKCRQSSVLPQTAAPAPGAFAAAFAELAAGGAEGIVCINLSSKLSATYQSAVAAARDCHDVTVEVIDSTNVSLGQGLLVVGAARLAEDGKSLQEIVAWVTGAAGRLRVYGLLDTLENLKKGGRIGGARALLGSMLSIKPVIEIRDGEVHEESKQRTRGRSLQYLATKVTEAAHAGQITELGIMHGDAPDIDKFIDLVAPSSGPTPGPAWSAWPGSRPRLRTERVGRLGPSLLMCQRQEALLVLLGDAIASPNSRKKTGRGSTRPARCPGRRGGGR